MKKFTRKEIEQKVNEVIIDKLCVDASEVSASAMMSKDLKADSIDAVEITMELEKEFYISISDDKMIGMIDCKVDDIYNLVEELINKTR